MRLRTQVLLAGAVTLMVPALGWQSIRQLNASLLEARVDAQELGVANLRAAFAESVLESPVLAARLERGDPVDGVGDVDVVRSPVPLFVDGYADDWQTLPRGVVPAQPVLTAPVTLRAASREARLYLHLDVRDNEVVAHRPPRLAIDAGENERPDPAMRLSNGDAVQLLVEYPGGAPLHLLFNVSAPGPLAALAASDGPSGGGVRSGAPASRVRAGDRIAGVTAALVRLPGGYALEASLPMPTPAAGFGFAVIDIDVAAARRAGGVPTDMTAFVTGRTAGLLRSPTVASRAWSGTLDPLAMEQLHARPATIDERLLPRLHEVSERALGFLDKRVPAGHRARLFDAAGRLLADVDRLNERPEIADQRRLEGIWDALLFRVFAWLVAGDLPLPADADPAAEPTRLDAARRTAGEAAEPTTRYVTLALDRVLGTLVPIGNDVRAGWLLYESNEEHSSAWTGSRLARLFSLLVLASLLATLVLLAWSMTLSLRITRLSRAASRTVGADGRIGPAPLVASRARDEIGELSRGVASLLGRSADYTRYLEALSGRLSHELRTPLSVVRTSIENLERGTLDAESTRLLERASGGADQLDGIIRSLVESTRLEQSLERAGFEDVDLDAFIDGCRERYAASHPTIRFARSGEVPGTVARVARVAPDLLVQALDKLVANAVSFSADGDVRLVLMRRENWIVGVANRGEPIPLVVREQMFQPMYSCRHASGDADVDLHLGLGLYLVRMIAERHGGEPQVFGKPPWSVVGLSLPAPRR